MDWAAIWSLLFTQIGGAPTHIGLIISPEGPHLLFLIFIQNGVTAPPQGRIRLRGGAHTCEEESTREGPPLGGFYFPRGGPSRGNNNPRRGGPSWEDYSSREGASLPEETFRRGDSPLRKRLSHREGASLPEETFRRGDHCSCRDHLIWSDHLQQRRSFAGGAIIGRESLLICRSVDLEHPNPFSK